MKSKIFISTILASTSIVGLTTSAFAQDIAAEEAGNQQANDKSDIVVTGSRVIKNGDDSPTPVTIVGTDSLVRTSPTTITDGLSKLPVFTNSPSRLNVTLARNNNNGAYINLRGMGNIRTLVLMDGQRLNASTQDGVVDTSTIPQMLIGRVDVVTGGASAVYGSDAVTGVVNFVIDRNFNGVKAQAQAGISGRGDLGNQRIGAALGTDLFGGRGHLLLSGEYFRSDGHFSNLRAREYGGSVYTYAGAGSTANPFVLIPNSRTTWSAAGGSAAFLTAPLRSIYEFTTGGNVVALNQGQPTATATTQSGGDGGIIDRGFAADAETPQGFARFDYDLTDDIHFHVQAMGSVSNSYGKYLPGGSAFLVVRTGNPFISDAARATLSANPVPFAFLFGKHDPSLPLELSSMVDAKVTNYRIMTGLEGNLGDALKWTANYSHGYTRQRVINMNNVNNGRYFAAVDSVRDPSGNIVCRVTLTHPGLYPGCVPINLFGPGSVTPEMIDYIADDTSFRLTNTMDDFNLSLSGSPFETWAGPVNFALSGEYRRVTLRNVSTNQPGSQNCTGLDPLNCKSTTLTYVTDVLADADVSQKVTEAAVEVMAPLIDESPILGSFNLLGAFRYTHYNTSGDVRTWKIGFDWKLTEDIRFRGTRSQDIRAPSLNELFQPAAFAPGTFFDIHTNTTNITNIVSQGNPDLVPEVAQTLTLGVVYKPSWLPRFSIAVDYYDIKLDNAIALISGTSTAVQRNCEDSNGTSPLCALFVRPGPFSDRSAANAPLFVLAQGLNVAKVETHGVDVETNYTFGLLGGDLSLRTLLSYQPKLVTTQFVGDAPINGAGAAQGAVGTSNVAKWRATAFVNYQRDGFNLNVQTRWRSSLRKHADARLVFADPRRIPAVSFTDVSLSYSIPSSLGTIQPFLTIENLFDKRPPLSVSVGSFPGLGTYHYLGDDIVGRYFTGGVRVKF